jgi:two-component system response regulator HydG
MEDVPLLAHHLLRKHAARHGRAVERLESAALAALCAYDWPGNVRELENTMERAVVLCRREGISLDELPAAVKLTRPQGSLLRAFDLPFVEAKHEFERNYLQHLVLNAKGGVAEAARIAGLDRSNFRRLLKRLEIDCGPLRED